MRDHGEQRPCLCVTHIHESHELYIYIYYLEYVYSVGK